ncbi:MAG: phosphoserine phosphatase SerB [Kangiellaceae bacterium]|jgi:phosphoserine phosphatase|nr:phosphoserine phosphatase SerB [Kangiellaceae bacterium]
MSNHDNKRKYWLSLWGEQLPESMQDSLAKLCSGNDLIVEHSETVADHMSRISYAAMLSQQQVEQIKQNLSLVAVNYAIRPWQYRSTIPKLMVFDMDSTLIQMECIDELARQCGFYPQVSAITERAMQGELDFSQSLKQRVALLDGLAESELDSLIHSLPITPGVQELTAWAKQQGMILVVVSGGFTPFVNHLRESLGFDHAYANHLESNGGVLTGKVVGEIVDGDKKRAVVEELMSRYSLAQQDVWAIGDGANDLPMMSSAGFGVAFNAKPKVRLAADAAINQIDMMQLTQCIGAD